MDAEFLPQILIVLAVFLVAVLYSSVGHGGASGYLAVMAFLAVAPTGDAPDGFGFKFFCRRRSPSFQFYRAGIFRLENFSAVCRGFAFRLLFWAE